MRVQGAVTAALLVLLVSPAAGQDPGTGPAAFSDTARAAPSVAPRAVSPAAPVRLDFTPGAKPPGSPGVPDPEAISSSFRRGVHAGESRFDFWARYNRVEGPATFASVTRELHRKSFLPAYRLQVGFAFSADRGQYRVGFEQPVATRNKLTLGAEGYREFLPFFYADEALSSGENSASAFFLHRDYWDWYEAEGVRGFVGVHPSPFLDLRLGIVQQDENTLENRTNWSLFNQKASFPRNRPVPAGEYRGFEASLLFDSRPRDEDGDLRYRGSWRSLEHWHRLTWERADAGLGGDFDLWRVTADLRNYLRITPNQALSTRLLVGTGESRDGALPAARRFEIGGLGTLRGQLYRSQQGNRVALAGAQYAFGMGKRHWLLFFTDAGSAWDHGSLFDQRILVDVGAGFRIGHSGPTLLVARTLDGDADFRAEIRFQESY